MNPPVALTIAGSDSSGGAGLQADLKTFSSFGVHGLTAVTCVVSETPLVVNSVHPVPPEVLRDQLSLLLASYPIGAIKTGMLYSKEHIMVVCELLENSQIPLVVDPVMVASTGAPLLQEDALEVIQTRLLPLATALTPNLPEASLLLAGMKITNLAQQEKAAHALAKHYSAACYLKGGHFEGTSTHRDLLAVDDQAHPMEAPHLDLPQAHGTGCTLAAAFTANLAKGLTLVESAQHAHAFTHRALTHSLIWEATAQRATLSHLQQTQPL